MSASPSVPPLTRTADWRAAVDAADREAAALAWIRRAHARTGHEHVVVLTRSGDLVHYGSSGLTHRVLVPPTAPGTDLLILHSHPNENSLSLADFVTAWSRSERSEARAATPAGSVFGGRASMDPARWMARWRRAFRAAASELRILGRRDGRPYTYLAEHLVNAEMERTGLICYEADLARSSRADVARLAPDRPALTAVLSRELEDDD